MSGTTRSVRMMFALCDDADGRSRRWWREVRWPASPMLLASNGKAEEPREQRAAAVSFAERMPERAAGPVDFGASFPSSGWYSDEVADSEEGVLVKSVQVGAFTYGVRWAVRQAGHVL